MTCKDKIPNNGPIAKSVNTIGVLKRETNILKS